MNQMGYTSADQAIQAEITERIEALARIADIAKQDNPVNILFEQFLDILIEMTGVESGVVKLLEPRGNYFLKPDVFHGVTTKYLEKMANSPLGNCLCAVSLAQKDITITSDITRDRLYSCPNCKAEGFKFIACIPIFCHNRPAGVIHLASSKIKKIKPSEQALMKCAGKIFSYALEYYDMVLTTNRYQEYSSLYLKTAKEPVIIVNKAMEIKNIGEYALSLLDVSKESMMNTDISAIMPDSAVKEIPKLAEHGGLINTSLKAKNGRDIAIAMKSHAVREEISKEIIRYVLEIECTQKEKTIQDEFNEFKQLVNDFLDVLHATDNSQDVKTFLDGTIIKISKYLPVMASKYLVYSYDVITHQLKLHAHKGYSNGYIKDNTALSSDNSFAYKTALTSNRICSTSEDGEWQTIIPIVYSGEVKGLLVFSSGEEYHETLDLKNRYMSVATLVAGIMEKHSAYDMLREASVEKAEISGKTDIIAKAIASKPKSLGDELEKFCSAILSISGCKTLKISFRSPENALYTYTKGGTLKREKSNLSQASREIYVLERGESLYYPDAQGRETNFEGDQELKGKYAAVIPLISKNMITAAIRLENDEFVKEIPENVIRIIVSIMSETIRCKKLADEATKANEEYSKNISELDSTRSVLDQETKRRIELEKQNVSMAESLAKSQTSEKQAKNDLLETQQNLSEEISERKMLEGEKRELEKKLKEAAENEEKQRNVIAEKQRNAVEERRQREEIASELKKMSKDLIAERQNHEEEINRLYTKLSEEQKKNQELEEERQDIIEEASLKLEAYVSRSEQEREEIIKKSQKTIDQQNELLQKAEKERTELIKQAEEERQDIMDEASLKLEAYVSRAEEEKKKITEAAKKHILAAKKKAEEESKAIIETKEKEIEVLKAEKEKIIQQAKKAIEEAAEAKAAQTAGPSQQDIDNITKEITEKAQKAIEEKDKNAAILIKLMAARTKAMMEASTAGMVLQILNKTGAQLSKTFETINPPDANALKEALASAKDQITGILRKNVWESLADTALKRISEIAAAKKLTAMLSQK